MEGERREKGGRKRKKEEEEEGDSGGNIVVLRENGVPVWEEYDWRKLEMSTKMAGTNGTVRSNACGHNSSVARVASSGVNSAGLSKLRPNSNACACPPAAPSAWRCARGVPVG